MSRVKNFWQQLPKPIIALAPMAGLTDPAFRQICKAKGADVVYTEMVSVAGINYQQFKTLKYLQFSNKEKPVVIQFFGSEPQQFAQACSLAERTGFDGIDINFGCPAKKVVRNNSGSRLMEQPQLAKKIIESCLNATKLPVSIKLRSAKGKITASQFIAELNNLPISAIMLHGRTYEQGFTGEPNWQEIKLIRKVYHGVLLANGGITTPEKARDLLANYPIDGLGLAQGVWGNPWLFQQIKNYLKKNKYPQPSWLQIKKTILEHGKLAEKYDNNLIEFRKHVLRYVSGRENASALRKKLVTITSYQDLKNILAEF